MKENYDRAFPILCELEGLESNVKGDPGGRTIWGITDKWFPTDVASMTRLSPEGARKYAEVFYKLLIRWNK
jgi:lysozyme family protein